METGAYGLDWRGWEEAELRSSRTPGSTANKPLGGSLQRGAATAQTWCVVRGRFRNPFAPSRLHLRCTGAELRCPKNRENRLEIVRIEAAAARRQWSRSESGLGDDRQEPNNGVVATRWRRNRILKANYLAAAHRSSKEPTNDALIRAKMNSDSSDLLDSKRRRADKETTRGPCALAFSIGSRVLRLQGARFELQDSRPRHNATTGSGRRRAG